jgi:chromosome segregation ATPase
MTKSDQELRDELASEYAHACAPAAHEFHRSCELGFRAGYDARQAQVDELRAELHIERGLSSTATHSWETARKERDQLRSDLTALREAAEGLAEALEKYQSCFKTIEAQVMLRPMWFNDTWTRQMKTILGDSDVTLQNYRAKFGQGK